MKLNIMSLVVLLGIGTLTSCSDKLDVVNPNQQTTATFGNIADDLQETVIAAYNHTRMEGSYARVGYTIDMTRGDEVWNASQVWYLEFDDFNVAANGDIAWWPWREWYYTINVCNFGLEKIGNTADTDLSTDLQHIKGQLLFLRGLAYYNLAGYYQTVPLITSYQTYSTMAGLYGSSNTFDEVMDQVEADFKEAIDLLPSKREGGEWGSGRVNSGAAAGFLARALMQRQKDSDALTYLKKIINGDYGTYKLMADYGDNFQQGAAYENNDESIYEVQFLDYGSQGTDDEWTPVNTSSNATQGSAIESNCAPGDYGGWADLSASPWLYQLFKKERTTSGSLDPRLYWTIGTYESDWDNYANGNVCYGAKMTASDTIHTNNNYGGLPIAKYTNFRTNLYSTVVTGLHDGINIRLMRYSDVLLRAAECENELNGPDQQAINWINQVRERAGLADLKLADFPTKDALFEQIANVERPKEFGCEYGRGFDLLRWGWFYNDGRLQQLKEHSTFLRSVHNVKNPVSYSEVGVNPLAKSSFDTYTPGHEFLPVQETLTNKNPNLLGNSANNSTSNADYYKEHNMTIHPVVNLGK